MLQDKSAIVIDNGSYECKAGMTGDDTPMSFRTVVGRPNKKGIMSGMDSDEVIYGDAAYALSSWLTLKSPLEYGFISDWSDMENIWHHLFSNELKVDPTDHPVVLTESPMNPKANREKIAQIFFETFNVPSFQLTQQGVLSLFRYGTTTGIVLDSGYDVTNIVPVFEYYPILNSALRISFAGNTLTQNLGSRLKDGYNYSTKLEDIKLKFCYIAIDYESEMQKYKESTAYDRVYILPDGNEILIRNERFICAELLFNPLFGFPNLLFNPELIGIQYIGRESLGIHQYLTNSINKCDQEIRRDLYSYIVLAGGNTLVPGFQERLQRELTQLVPSNRKVKIIAPDDRKISCWIGGSILSSLSTFVWITRQEYNENGSTIINKK